MLSKNQTLTLTIESLSDGAMGVARQDGFVVFVKGALYGETVLAKIISVKKSYAIAILLEVLQPSKDRVDAPCPVFLKCGGCDLQHLRYSEQLVYKQQKVADAIKKIGKIEGACVLPCVASDQIYGYRNKLSVPIRQGSKGLEVGFFAKNSHRITDFSDCILQRKSAKKAVKITHDFLIKNGLSAYDENSKKGLVRHLVARDICNSVVCALVINGGFKPPLKALGEVLTAELGDSTAFYVNYNTKNDNIIMGEKSQFICGKQQLFFEITVQNRHFKFPLNPHSFFQINEQVFLKIVQKIDQYLAKMQPQFLIDAYAGVGLMTSILASRVHRAFGIEIVKEAVHDAVILAQLNGVQNASFIEGDCANEIVKLLKSPEIGKSLDQTLLILDPPRKGCDGSVMEAIDKNPPKNLIYLSCDPSTLARDLARLSNYTIEFIEPFDMFPQTDNVETLAFLRRRD